MSSATIKLFLPHGDPRRLRTAEISNWSGKSVAAPRTDLDEGLARGVPHQRDDTFEFAARRAGRLSSDLSSAVRERNSLRERSRPMACILERVALNFAPCPAAGEASPFRSGATGEA